MIPPTCYSSCSYSEYKNPPHTITFVVTSLLFAASLISWLAGSGQFTAVALGSLGVIGLAISIILKHCKSTPPLPPKKIEEVITPPPAHTPHFTQVLDALKNQTLQLDDLEKAEPSVFDQTTESGETLADIAITQGAPTPIVQSLIARQKNYSTRQALDALNRSPVKDDSAYRMQVLMMLHSRVT